MTKFTYFEPLIDGHCTFWARMVLGLAARDPRITRLRLVTGTEMARRLEDHIAGLGVEVEVIAADQLATMTTGTLFQRGKAQWVAARKFAQDGPVFLPFFDHAVVAAAADVMPLPRGQRVSGVIFRPPNNHGLPVTAKRRVDALRRWATYILARRTTRGPLFTLDEVAAQSATSRRTGALAYLPDPAPDLTLLGAASPRNRKDGRSVALVFGALTERKGIFQTLAAWKHLPAENRGRLALRFVGRLGTDERAPFVQALATEQGRMPDAVIELEDRFVSDEELAEEILGAAIILAPYQNHIGSSGVMHWAVTAGKPLIAQKTGLIGYQVEHYGLGIATDCGDPEQIAAAILSAARRAGEGATLSDKARSFAEFHTPATFVRTILNEMV